MWKILCQQCHKHFLQYNAFASERPQVRTWGAKLASFPGRHLTSLRLCTSRLSSQSGEICLQKYLPISGKLSITSYLKQNAVDCRSHLTMENNLKVEKGILFRKQAQLSLLKKQTFGVRVETNMPKNSKGIMLALCPWTGQASDFVLSWTFVQKLLLAGRGVLLKKRCGMPFPHQI